MLVLCSFWSFNGFKCRYGKMFSFLVSFLRLLLFSWLSFSFCLSVKAFLFQLANYTKPWRHNYRFRDLLKKVSIVEKYRDGNTDSAYNRWKRWTGSSKLFWNVNKSKIICKCETKVTFSRILKAILSRPKSYKIIRSNK